MQDVIAVAKVGDENGWGSGGVAMSPSVEAKMRSPVT